MNVVIDGHVFALKAGTGVTRQPLIEWPENIRLDGQQKRKDRSYLSSLVIDNWSNGFGLQRQTNPDLARQQYRIWDAENVDTRYPNQIILSPAFQSCTITPSRGDLNLAFTYLNNVYFAETTFVSASTSDTAVPMARVYKFAVPNTLGSDSNLAQIAPSDPITGQATVGSLSGVRAYGGNIAFTYFIRSTGGYFAEGNKYGVVGQLNATLTGSAENQTSLGTYPIIRYARFGDFGGTLHLIDYVNNNPPNNNRIDFYLGNMSQASLTSVANLTSRVGSYLPPLVTDGLTMYAMKDTGILDFDNTPATAIDISDSQEPNGQMVMYRNNLYFTNGQQLIKYDGTNLTSVGYDKEDGLPSDKMGKITALTSNFKWIYAAVKGATYSHILTFDGDAWQYYARIPTAGIWVRELFLSNAPDAIDRLWCMFDNYSIPGYFLNPVVNPLQAGTYSYVPTGHITIPELTGGLEEISGAFFDCSVAAKAINDGTQKSAILVNYGVDGSLPTTATLGIFSGVVGTPAPSSIAFNNPYGVEGKEITIRYLLTNTGFVGQNPVPGTSPVLLSSVIHYLKDPDKRQSFQFTIDLNKTAREQALPLEGVIGTLTAITNSKILMPFWYGLSGTSNVKVLDIPAIEKIDESREIDAGRSGLVQIRIAEIL